MSTAQQHHFKSSLIKTCIKEDISTSITTDTKQQSNPSLGLIHGDQTSYFNSKPVYEKKIDNHENNFSSKLFSRSPSRTQSLINRTISPAKPIVFREDVPIDEKDNRRVKSAIPPRTLPKPTINIHAFLKQSNSVSSSFSKVK